MHVVPIDLASDLDSVKNVATQAFKDSPDASLDQWFSFLEMEKAIRANRGICLKAVADDAEIVGMLYAQEENPINGQEGLEKWVIVIAAVSPEKEGQGIGSALLKEIEKQAGERGVLKMFVYTNKNDEEVINFYKKNDYEEAGFITDYQYGKDNSAIFLLKYLR
ncbi:MAG TPA: N-acetyltransferase [Clostridia bacterium]